MIKMRRIVSVDALCKYLDNGKHITQPLIDCPNLRELREDIEFVYKGSRVYTRGRLVCCDSLYKESQDIGCCLGDLRIENGVLVTECTNGRHFSLLNIKNGSI